MQAIILLGGKGTRLQTLYSDRPKALVPIAGRPFIEWQLEWLGRGAVHGVHFAAGYKADVLDKWLTSRKGSGSVLRVSSFEFQVSLSTEPSPLGTGGGLKHVESDIRSDPFLVLNGDSLMPNMSFQSLEKSAAVFPMIGKSHEPRAVLAVTRIEESGRYGTVEFDAQHRVTAFREKAERSGGWVNGGVYLMNRAALAQIEPGKALSIETDIFPEMARRGQLRVYQAEPPLLDMGTPEGIASMETWLAANG